MGITTTDLTTEQRALRGVTRGLALVPLVTGALGVLGGPRTAPGGGETTPSVDSEYRFTALFWAAAGGVLWWSSNAPRERGAVTRAAFALAGAGAVPRLLSWRAEGAPHPVFQGALALEAVGMPAVIAWHRRAFG